MEDLCAMHTSMGNHITSISTHRCRYRLHIYAFHYWNYLTPTTIARITVDIIDDVDE
jgi:hypothetical protein